MLFIGPKLVQYGVLTDQIVQFVQKISDSLSHYCADFYMSACHSLYGLEYGKVEALGQQIPKIWASLKRAKKDKDAVKGLHYIRSFIAQCTHIADLSSVPKIWLTECPGQSTEDLQLLAHFEPAENWTQVLERLEYRV